MTCVEVTHMVEDMPEGFFGVRNRFMADERKASFGGGGGQAGSAVRRPTCGTMT